MAPRPFRRPLDTAPVAFGFKVEAFLSGAFSSCGRPEGHVGADGRGIESKLRSATESDGKASFLRPLSEDFLISVIQAAPWGPEFVTRRDGLAKWAHGIDEPWVSGGFQDVDLWFSDV